MSDDGRTCWLCHRAIGQRMEWHHPVPRQKGGRLRVPVHPICHRTIHRHFNNARLARIGEQVEQLRGEPEVAKFLAWVSDKPPDFHAPTRGGKRR